jgi:bacterioferritin
MKGNSAIIDQLNLLLADELTAINQYMVHSEMCANWGYERLHSAVEARAITEMKHAEKLIARIIYFEGAPVVNNLNKIHIGAAVDAQIRNDLESEVGAVQMYNAAIELCVQHRDNGTREMLEEILEDEETHVDWLEAQLDQIQQMGMENYLSQQVK